MSRILLVDDSPHAQRMGERILSDEGYEVVTVSNADSALIRLEDVDPDVVLADTVMPGRTGYEICQYLKMNPRHRHVRVILTAGVLEPFDEDHVKRVEADGSLKKPFEATALLDAVRPLAEAALAARTNSGPKAGPAAAREQAAPFVAVVDAEQVRAAVTVALDAAMENMVGEIANRVMAALIPKKGEEHTAAHDTPARSFSAPASVPLAASAAAPLTPSAQPVPPAEGAVRRVSSLRARRGSILGLSLDSPQPEDPEPGPRP